MSNNQSLAQRAGQVLLNTYGERTLALVSGTGAEVWDADGNRYLDFLAGIAVNNTGHCHPKVVEAIRRQAETLIHVSNLYLIEPQIELAEALVQKTFAEKVFFSNSGAEANEGAIKIARRRGSARGRFEILCFEGSFHGRTLATIAATGQKKYHEQGFGPLPEGFVHAPFNDLDAAAAMLNEKSCAILVEPVQGEGGVQPARPEFLHGLRGLCDEHDLLLIFDEVQCGMGRTGHLLAAEHYGVAPDVATLAKALGGGAPIGAILCGPRAADVLAPGTHAHTFGGNPLVCAAALAALEVLSDPALLARVAELGQYFRSELTKLAEEFPVLVEVRGAGLMVGVEVQAAGPEIIAALGKRRILANCAAGNVLRFLPPLVIERIHIDEVVAALRDVLLEGVLP